MISETKRSSQFVWLRSVYDDVFFFIYLPTVIMVPSLALGQLYFHSASEVISLRDKDKINQRVTTTKQNRRIWISLKRGQ